MPSGNREVLISTVFVPGDPVSPGAYMRNCAGSVTPAIPDTVGIGHFRMTSPIALDQTRVSITARAFNAAGTSRIVTATLSGGTQPTANPTTVDIFLRTDVADALTNDALFCEVTIALLPL